MGINFCDKIMSTKTKNKMLNTIYLHIDFILSCALQKTQDCWIFCTCILIVRLFELIKILKLKDWELCNIVIHKIKLRESVSLIIQQKIWREKTPDYLTIMLLIKSFSNKLKMHVNSKKVLVNLKSLVFRPVLWSLLDSIFPHE